MENQQLKDAPNAKMSGTAPENARSKDGRITSRCALPYPRSERRMNKETQRSKILTRRKLSKKRRRKRRNQ